MEAEMVQWDSRQLIAGEEDPRDVFQIRRIT